MRIVTFGDSFTAGYGVSDSSKWRGHGRPDKFEDFYRRMNSWPRFLADKLDLPVVNMGMCDNFGNRDIYNLIKENKDEFLNDDIIIVAFSYPYRNETSPIEDYKLIDDLLSDYKRFYFNAFFPMFKEESIDGLNLSNFVEPDLAFSDYLSKCEKESNIPHFERNCFWDEESRRGGYIHPNLIGYKKISEYVYLKIRDKVC